MGVLNLDYCQTSDRARFKRRSGHTTQQLLTLIVGVDAVRNGAEAASTLPASWNPRDTGDAADRARVFALNAALLWNVESAISYVRGLTRSKPVPLNVEIADLVRRTVDKEHKLVVLFRGLNVSAIDELALVRAGYVWRNRVTHYEATNRMAAEVSDHLQNHAERIATGYQGLNVGELVKRVHSGEPPRLKEVTAIIRATSGLVRAIDERVVVDRGALRYLRDGLVNYLTDSTSGTPGQKASGLWGGTEEQNRRSLENFGAQISLSRVDRGIADDEGLAALSPKEAVRDLLEELQLPQ